VATMILVGECSDRPCREAAIVEALFLERRQHCRVQIIEGPNGELMDRVKFELEHLMRRSRFRSDLLRS
jgi:hypothetical protein